MRTPTESRQIPHLGQGDRHFGNDVAGVRCESSSHGDAIIAYDKDLPEIPGRRPWEKPTSFLVKDTKSPTGWRVDASGRRASTMLLVPKIRGEVDQWRDAGYPGASAVARRLFEYWFEEDHDVPGFGVPFRYYFCQREAIDTLVWLVEIATKGREKLINRATIYKSGLFNKNIDFRRRRRPAANRALCAGQDARRTALPPESILRLQDGDGFGQTWVMAMAMVYSRYKLMMPKSGFRPFLIVAPIHRSSGWKGLCQQQIFTSCR